MSQNRNGLSGKSRRVHHKRRADRLYDLHLIDEYLEGDEQENRYIPIRHSGSFHPTMAKLSESRLESDEEVQLELPLKLHTDDEMAATPLLPTELVDVVSDEHESEFIDETSDEATTAVEDVNSDESDEYVEEVYVVEEEMIEDDVEGLVVEDDDMEEGDDEVIDEVEDAWAEESLDENWAEERAAIAEVPVQQTVEEDLPMPLQNNRYEMFEFRSRKAAGSFSLRRFLVGCAAGGLTAVVLLALIDAVL
ncbi:MAG: hypothetical protein ACPGXK_03860 [Phycisphaerae bacterium]